MCYTFYVQTKGVTALDLKLVEYIVAIEDYGNMTEAAAQLFITPSALNQQLLKLEGELKLPLFTRSKRQMIPTQAGRIYLDAARQMLMLRQSAYAHLQDLSDCNIGTYHVGLTFEHGSDIFAMIYPQFHIKYPNIQLTCHQLLVPELMKMLDNNQLDIVFTLSGHPERYTEFEYIPCSTENLVLGLPRTHPLAKGIDLWKAPYSVIDLQLVKNDSFAVALERATMRTEVIDPMFEAAGFAPHIMIESSFNSFLEQLAAQGICDAIIPQSRVRNHKDVAWFYLPGSPRFHFGVSYAKGYRLNRALQDFIEMTRLTALQIQNFPPPNNLFPLI